MSYFDSQRKSGAHAVEDRRGTRTLIAYDQENDQIIHVKVGTDGSLSVDTVDVHNATFYDYSGDDLVYKGLNESYDADGSESNWTIFKYTYVSENLTRKQKQTGVWNNRASLSW